MGKNLESALQKYKNYGSFWDYVRAETTLRFKRLKEILSQIECIEVLELQGTYFAYLDVSNLKGEIPEKYYYRIDDPTTKTKELDKAFSRFLFSFGIGTIPMSTLCLNSSNDNIVRIPFFRSDEDF